MRPDISIIVPAFNLEAYIAEAIASALAQVGVEHEVIVVDDGSTDGTGERIAAFLGHPRLRVISQGNTGPARSRNVGIEAAGGRYVGFLDGDDLWDPDKARRHVALMDARPDLDVSYSWWRVIDADGVVTGRSNTCRPEDLPYGIGFEGLIVENFTGTASTVVCRREAVRAVGGMDPSLRSNVDLDLLLRMALLRERNIGLVAEVLTSYRSHGSQITGDWRRMQSNWELVLEKARRLAPARTAAVEAVARGRVSRYFAYIAYVRGDHASARRLIRRAWRGAWRSMLRDRRAWLTTVAVAATLLPAPVHGALSRLAQRLLGRTMAA